MTFRTGSHYLAYALFLQPLHVGLEACDQLTTCEIFRHIGPHELGVGNIVLMTVSGQVPLFGRWSGHAPMLHVDE